MFPVDTFSDDLSQAFDQSGSDEMTTTELGIHYGYIQDGDDEVSICMAFIHSFIHSQETENILHLFTIMFSFQQSIFLVASCSINTAGLHSPFLSSSSFINIVLRPHGSFPGLGYDHGLG